MKLLITTQAIDENDPILGFFARWVEEFAHHFEHIHVVCLTMGEHHLPQNVTVHSLGKEDGESRLKYIRTFYKTIFSLKGEYDVVFSHMNPHYIVLAGLYWKFKKIRMFFWRNHARMNTMTRIAAFFAERVFHTSPFACTASFKHAVQMPVGIDTGVFKPTDVTENREEGVIKILSLGRLSPVKHIELMIEAVTLLPSKYKLHIYGEAPKQDTAYFEKLQALGNERTIFHSSVPNSKSPHVYNSHDLFLNFTPDGSMDKTVLEASACECLTLFTNKSFCNTLDDMQYVSDATPLRIAEKIEELSQLASNDKDVLKTNGRKAVVEQHSLKKLAGELTQYIHG